MQVESTGLGSVNSKLSKSLLDSLVLFPSSLGNAFGTPTHLSAVQKKPITLSILSMVSLMRPETHHRGQWELDINHLVIHSLQPTIC